MTTLFAKDLNPGELLSESSAVNVSLRRNVIYRTPSLGEGGLVGGAVVIGTVEGVVPGVPLVAAVVAVRVVTAE